LTVSQCPNKKKKKKKKKKDQTTDHVWALDEAMSRNRNRRRRNMDQIEASHGASDLSR